MAKLIFSMNQTLDGYVDHDHPQMNLSPTLFRHWTEQVRNAAGSIYGRRTYELMSSWDQDDPQRDSDHHEFASAWRSQPKWVVSRTLKSVGPNATLIGDNFESVVRDLKDRLAGELAVAGPELARSLGDLGLIDEYRLYLQPIVAGHGRPFFAGPRPALRFVASDQMDEQAVRLTYAAA